MKRTIPTAMAVLATSVLLAACDSSVATPTSEESTASATTPTGAGSEPATPTGAVSEPAPTTDEVVEVVGLDYGFESPDELPVGATLAFSNGSDTEFHEIAVMRLADDEERSVEELLELPEEEAMSAMTFVGVAAARPGEDGEVIDGTLTLEEPGRYVFTCFVPQGADPDVAAEAFFGEPEGPPDLGDGPPHAMVGMVKEVTVG